MKIVVYSFMELERPCYAGLEEELGVELVFCPEPPTMQSALRAQGAQAVSVVTTPVDAALIDEFYRLGVRYISTRNVGYDHIDVEHAWQVGMGVGNAGYQPNNVAEYAVMLILMSTRKGAVIDRAYQKQDYSLAGKMGTMLKGSTVGVVGTGKIGRTVIQLLSGFGCHILAYDPFPSDETAACAEYVDLSTLLRQSDVITLHAPRTEESYHLIDRAAIAEMKPGVILVNTARGALVDTEALIEGLESGKIGYAALDVLEGETPVYYKNFEGQPIPLEAIEKLSRLPNVLLTPHTAFYTRQAIFEMVRNSITSCVREMRGEANPWKIV